MSAAQIASLENQHIVPVAAFDINGNANDATHPIYVAQVSGGGGATTPGNPLPVGTINTFWSNFGVIGATQIGAGAKTVKRVRGLNGTNVLYYLQLHDKATAPIAGDVPKVSFPIGIGVATSLTVDERPTSSDAFACALGVYVVWSSTWGTYTAVSPATQGIEVEYAV